MNKYKKLIQNSGIFLIANFGSKIVSFLLVRFYTEFLTTNEFGIVDLIITTASLASPIISLCITEAVLRFSIDDISNREKIYSAGLWTTLSGSIVFLLLIPCLNRFDVFRGNTALIYSLTISNSLYSVSAHFCRGIGKTGIFATSGLIHTILQIGLNILFLMEFNLGVRGYLLASVLANAFSTVFVFALGKLYRYVRIRADRTYLKQMLLYSIPLIPNTVFWWIMQSSDRYVITYMLDSSATGLYSVANKIPTIIATISTIFFQAWQLSSVDEAKSKDKGEFYTSVFQTLSMVLIVACSFIMFILQPLYSVLVEKSYYVGWQCAPFLLCAMIFSCYSSFLGTNYVAMKKTKGVFLTTVIGAVTNIVLNFVLTPIMGISGTALATVVSFMITWLVRAFDTRKFVKIEYPLITFSIPTLLVLIQAVLLTAGVISMWIQLAFLLVITALYWEKIYSLMRRLISVGKSFINRRRNNSEG